MTHLHIDDQAPDFSLADHKGEVFHLTEQLKTGRVLLVFNLGFA